MKYEELVHNQPVESIHHPTDPIIQTSTALCVHLINGILTPPSLFKARVIGLLQINAMEYVIFTLSMSMNKVEN